MKDIKELKDCGFYLEGVLDKWGGNCELQRGGICKNVLNCYPKENEQLKQQLLASKQENKPVKCEQCGQDKHIQRCHAWLVGEDGKPLKYICLDCLMENAGINKILFENKKMREALEKIRKSKLEKCIYPENHRYNNKCTTCLTQCRQFIATQALSQKEER